MIFLVLLVLTARASMFGRIVDVLAPPEEKFEKRMIQLVTNLGGQDYLVSKIRQDFIVNPPNARQLVLLKKIPDSLLIAHPETVLLFLAFREIQEPDTQAYIANNFLAINQDLASSLQIMLERLADEWLGCASQSPHPVCTLYMHMLKDLLYTCAQQPARRSDIALALSSFFVFADSDMISLMVPDFTEHEIGAPKQH